MKKFDDKFRAELRDAVQSLEQRSATELVVALLPSVDKHWLAHVIFATGFSFAWLTVLMFIPKEIWYVQIYYETLLAFVAGWFVLYGLPWVKRWIMGRKYLRRRVEEKARALFQEGQLYETRHRTGLLVVLSFFEKEAVVIADDGVFQSLPVREYAMLQTRFKDVFKSRDPAQAVLDAIGRCKDALSLYVPRTEDDINELPDDLWRH